MAPSSHVATENNCRPGIPKYLYSDKRNQLQLGTSFIHLMKCWKRSWADPSKASLVSWIVFLYFFSLSNKRLLLLLL